MRVRAYGFVLFILFIISFIEKKVRHDFYWVCHIALIFFFFHFFGFIYLIITIFLIKKCC